MARPIGSKSTLGGKSVLWASDNYGWQSPGSYKKLEQQGKFKLGAQFLDRLGSYLGPAMQNIQGFQKEFRKATDKIPGMQAAERAVTGAMIQEDKLPSSVVARGGAVVAQRAGNALNIDPRIAGIGGLLIGGVHTSGPKKGTYKWKPTGDLKPHAELIEDSIESAHQHFVKHNSLDGHKNLIDLPDGRQIRISNKGGVNFERRVGLSPVAVAPKTGKAVAPSTPKPNVSTQVQAPKPVVAPTSPPTSPPTTASTSKPSFGPPPRPEQPRLSGTPKWANTPDLELGRKSLIDAGLPDPNLRFNPLPKPEHRTFPGRTGKSGYEVFATVPHPKTGKVQDSIGEFYSQSRAGATIDGVVYKPGKDNTYAVPGTDKPLRIGNREVVIEGAASRQARIRQIPGNENIKVDSEQAHHIKPLKDLASFAKMFDDQSLVYRTLDKLDEVYGSTILNRLDLSTRSHQPSFPNSVHDRLLNRAPGSPESGYILEAPQGTSRWVFLEGLPDTEKLKYLPYLLADAEQNVRAAQQVAFSENLLLPGSHPLTDKFVGNFAQRVMAPPNKEALKLIRQLTVDTRKAFKNRSLLKLDGTP